MKLLLIEDDRKIAALVRQGLEAEGYTVEVTSDGNDGRWIATERSHDLIVLDILLPGRNGPSERAPLLGAGDGRELPPVGSLRSRADAMPHCAGSRASGISVPGE